MKRTHAVKKGDTFVALFEHPSDAYELRDELRDQLPDSCYVHVDEHVLFGSLDERNELAD